MDLSFLVVGLGNPGKVYDYTRHNVGFYLVDTYVSHQGGTWTQEPRHSGWLSVVYTPHAKVLCLKPTTSMNYSGTAVRSVCDHYHIDLQNVLVVCDDISIALGRFKVSIKPGSAGHNGIKHILECCGSGFARYRVGVGRKPQEMCLSDYVLAKFSPEEQAKLPEVAAAFEKNLEVFIDKGILMGLNFIERL